MILLNIHNENYAYLFICSRSSPDIQWGPPVPSDLNKTNPMEVRNPKISVYSEEVNFQS